METLDFHSSNEMFYCAEQSHDFGMNSLVDLFGHQLDSGVIPFGDVADDDSCCSDEDDVIDIETIDELDSMLIASSLKTFSSARTMPADSLTKKDKSRKNSLRKLTLSNESDKLSCRTRTDSEIILNEMVTLQEKADSSFDNLELFMDQLFDTGVNLDQFANESFQVLEDINGIEAEDLESLFQQFEANTEMEDVLVPQDLCNASDGSLMASSKQETLLAAVKPKARSISLDQYRKTRGISQITSLPNTPTVPVAPVLSEVVAPIPSVTAPTVPSVSSVVTPLPSAAVDPVTSDTTPVPSVASAPVFPTVMQETVSTLQITAIQEAQATQVKETTDDTLKHEQEPVAQQTVSVQCAPTDINTNGTASPPSSDSNRQPLKSLLSPAGNSLELCNQTSLSSVTADHDYCGWKTYTNAKASASTYILRPITQQKQLPKDRDYKSEIITLLNEIPQLINSSNIPVSSTSSTDNIAPSPQSVPSPSQSRCSVDSRNYDERSCEKYSSDELVKNGKTGTEKSTLPKSYSQPPRGRHRKRHYRDRSRSSSEDSLSSSCSKYSSSDDSSLYSNSSDSSSDYSSSDESIRCSCEKSRCRHNRRHKSSKKHRHSKRNTSHSKSSRQSRHKSSRSKHKRKRLRSSRSSQSISSGRSSSSSRSRSPSLSRSNRLRLKEQAHNTAMLERRVVYVGGIGENYARGDLRKRFGGFGEIERVTIHQRDNGEKYGFVTFFNKADAYAAIEKGNDVYGPKFSLGFGGRRQFCDTEYADLDGCQAVKEEWATSLRRNKSVEDDFDALLKRSMKKMGP